MAADKLLISPSYCVFKCPRMRSGIALPTPLPTTMPAAFAPCSESIPKKPAMLR